MAYVNVAGRSGERRQQVRHAARQHRAKKAPDNRGGNRQEVARRTRTTKSLRLRVCAKVAQRPVDFLAIVAASVASIVIIVNAVFLQSGPRIYQPEQLSSKLQKTQETLKSETERLQHKIDSALAGVKIMEARSGSRRAH
jgi:hypothetical protein